jgi:hypothetical protein
MYGRVFGALSSLQVLVCVLPSVMLDVRQPADRGQIACLVACALETLFGGVARLSEANDQVLFERVDFKLIQ